MKPGVISRTFLGCCLVVLAALPAQARAADATVVMLIGHAVVQSPADGSVRKLSKGATVASGDTISTNEKSYVNLRFADGGFVVLRPLSKFQIEQYTLSQTDAAKVASTPSPASRRDIAA